MQKQKQEQEQKKKQSNFTKSNSKLKKLPLLKKAAADKKALLSYLSAEYGILYFHQMFAYKLDYINDGTFQNLHSPIKYDILLDMFRFYKNYLDEQRIYNMKKGKSFESQQVALNYDLAVVLSRHTDYLQAMEHEKIWSVDKEKTLAVTRLVDKTMVITNTVSQDCIDDDSIDINKMLDEW